MGAEKLTFNNHPTFIADVEQNYKEIPFIGDHLVFTYTWKGISFAIGYERGRHKWYSNTFWINFLFFGIDINW